eukprot:838548-Prymnesium_polylepis.1
MGRACAARTRWTCGGHGACAAARTRWTCGGHGACVCGAHVGHVAVAQPEHVADHGARGERRRVGEPPVEPRRGLRPPLDEEVVEHRPEVLLAPCHREAARAP